MASKIYLKRRFTRREIVLLVVLFVVAFIGLYMGLVYYPLSQERARIAEELQTTEDSIVVNQALKAQYDDMVAELKRIEQSGDKTHMPNYDNNAQQEKLHAYFRTIFAGMDSDISFSISSPQNGVRIRNVSFSFTVSEANKGSLPSVYDKVKSTLHDLLTVTECRCSMSSLSLRPDGGDLKNATSIGVSCTIAFYELDS